MYKKLLVSLTAVLILGFVFTACAPAAAAPAAGAEEEVAAVEFKSKDPTTFVAVSIGEPDLLDPAADYETAGAEVNQNIREPLIFYNRESAIDYVPLLATGWEVSDDGLTYTFTIRQGVKFHSGNDFTPSDAAYSLQRAVLMGGPSSTPSILLAEPILGGGMIDITELVDASGALMDDNVGIVDADPALLKAACDYVKSAIVADDANWTLTVTLPAPFAPFIGALGHSVGSILDKEWAIENGAWDDSCDTWQNYYAIPAENNPLAEIADGTGPFKFVSWDHATKTVTLERNDDYWRTEELWPGAHTGPAALKTVLIKGVDEWGTRFSMFQAGDADWVAVPRANISQVDPLVGLRVDYDPATGVPGEPQVVAADQPLVLHYGATALNRTDVFMNEDVKVEEGAQNIFIGSGSTKGGYGIPTNFFRDANVRHAFNYCMDWDTFIADYMLGEAELLPFALSLPGQLGFDPEGAKYGYDLAKCEEEFKAAAITDADGNQLWDTGFYFIATFNQGNVARKTILEILKAGITAVNPKFRMEVLQMPWATMLRYYQAGQLPMYVIGWLEDYHDPHNWYSPYISGTYGIAASFDPATRTEWMDYVTRGIEATDPAERDAIYKELNQKVFDYAPFILGPLGIVRVYLQRYVQGYYYNAIYSNLYYYELSKD